MSAIACFAGFIVRDLETSLAWYTEVLRAGEVERGETWACLHLAGGGRVELTAGDPLAPGLTFPSYGTEAGPPVMPGFGVEEPDGVATGLQVARSLPDWIVVVAPDRLRVVLTRAELDGSPDLVGFRWVSPDPRAQSEFLTRLGAPTDVAEGPTAGVIPVFRGNRDELLTDPDGTPVQLVVAGG